MRFATVFAPDVAATPEFAPWFTWVAALAVGVVFPLTNAPIEELFYRGYAQSRLQRSTGSGSVAVLVPTLGFSLQHLGLAPTVAAIPVFLVAFFVWGLGAALIRRWHGRLVPLVVAHLLTNAAFGIVPLVILASGSAP